jgi:bifunctional DNase/RNase
MSDHNVRVSEPELESPDDFGSEGALESHGSASEKVDITGFVPARIGYVGVRLPDPYAWVRLEVDEPPGLLEFPISIEQGRYLAQVLGDAKVPRPLTHELVSRIFKAHGITLAYVAIVGESDGNLIGQVATLGEDGSIHHFDARVSDALILAVAQPVIAPILVNPQLFASEDS